MRRPSGDQAKAPTPDFSAVSGQASPTRISLNIAGGVSGSMNVNFSASSQSLSVTTSGATFKGLTINLTRSS